MNTNAKHTPGKWTTKIHQPGTMLTVENETGEYVCSLLGGDEHKQENARLIAAAPELLAALKGLFEHCAMIHRVWGDGSNQKEADAAIAAGKAAIAQAEGGAQ